uniref:Gamma-aminobutyric acid receptor subunit beta n=1 Tax=Ditylenchus dipsaci TaxID=166011 RepID=A0A915DD23_9BILA
MPQVHNKLLNPRRRPASPINYSPDTTPSTSSYCCSTHPHYPSSTYAHGDPNEQNVNTVKFTLPALLPTTFLEMGNRKRCKRNDRLEWSDCSRRKPRNLRFLCFLLLSCCVLFPQATEATNWSKDEISNQPAGPNTTYISQVLNRLTDRTKYDKRLRPKYGQGPVDVGITVHVSSISAVSEVINPKSAGINVRVDAAFDKLDLGFERITSLTVGVDYLDRLWKPDTFFPNEKKSFFHTATTHNSFLRIEPDGRVSTSQRLTVTATCPMQLQLFPMDFQTCRLEIESYGYTTGDIDMYWGARRSDSTSPQKAVAFDHFSLPQFRRTGYRVNVTKAVTSSGEYVRLYFEVILSRNLGFYLMNIIIPSMLIVSISWVSFWLSREASPARVGLGVTTVLTMTTLITTTNNSMPKVSYIKGLDVFLNFCFVMVFASLVEYAVVSY